MYISTLLDYEKHEEKTHTMTMTLEAADAAIFLTKNQQKPPTHEFIAGDVFRGFGSLLVSDTIGQQHAAITEIVLACSEVLIGDKKFMKLYDNSAPVFTNLGFQHVLRNRTLTSLLVKRDPTTFLQFVFRPAENKVQIFDSSRLDHPTFDMSESVHTPYFTTLEQAITQSLLSKMVLTCEGMMIKS